jgi:MFS family permease
LFDWKRNNGGYSGPPPGFRRFQILYLIPYLLATFADWIQGPYVYALYEAYGYGKRVNGVLFIFGFASSMIIGTKVGSMADRYGRKRFAILYCVMYSLACVLKHFNNIYLLVLGRLFSGVSTSLLFSVFDSWMCSEHNRRGFDAGLLSGTYRIGTFLNSLVAIGSGIISQKLTNLNKLRNYSNFFYFNEFLNSFDFAITILVINMIIIIFGWSENFGKIEKFKKLNLNFQICLLIGIASLFESSMYIFVFFWSPSLSGEVPHGLVFTLFMIGVMLGSMVKFPLFVSLILAFISHFLVSMNSGDNSLILIYFVIFEISVGCYFPSIGYLKSQIVPEDSRAAVYSLFRVPLNFIVISTLLMNFEPKTAFKLTSGLLLGSVIIERILNRQLSVRKEL